MHPVRGGGGGGGLLPLRKKAIKRGNRVIKKSEGKNGNAVNMKSLRTSGHVRRFENYV